MDELAQDLDAAGFSTDSEFDPPTPQIGAVKKLAPHHRAICRALASGLRPSEVCARFGLSSSWLSQLMATPLFKAEVARLETQAETAAIDAEIRSLLPRAVEVIAEELFSPTPTKTRVDSAFKLLDRTGFEPKGQGKAGDDNRRYTIVTLTPSPGEDPAEAMKRVKEAATLYREDDGEDDLVDV